MRFVAAVLIASLPWRLKRALLVRFFGAKIAKDAKIGVSIVLAKRIEIGAGARIGHLNVIRGMSLLSLGDGAIIGNLNWITAFPENAGGHFAHLPERKPHLVLEEHATITNRHLIECTDLVHIGRFGGIGGFRCQILTHGVDLYRCRQTAKGVHIGAYSYVGTGCIILAGSTLPARSILGAGSVLTGVFKEEGHLYRGNPAVMVRKIVTDRGFFVRTSGFIK